MKNIFVVFFLIAAVVFGALYLKQSGKNAETNATIAALEQQVAEKAAAVAQQEKAAASLRNRLANPNPEIVSQTRGTVPMPESAVAPEAATNAKPSNPIAEMMKSPEMREMIKTQQKTMLGPMIDKNYAKLISDLHLSPEQATAFKDLLLQKQLSGADFGMAMMGDDVDESKRTEVLAQMKAQNDASDAAIKQLLGDNNYPQFQDYEKTQTERTEVSAFKDQLGSGPAALTPDQEEQLIQTMADARKNFKFTTDYSDQTKLTGDLSGMFSEDKLNQFTDEMTNLNQQYVAQAQKILTPDQMAAFQKYLDNQAAMQKMGISMAAKMFGGKASAK